jgi:hypothetical protein
MRLKYHKMHGMRQLDKHGKRIYKNSILRFKSFDRLICSRNFEIEESNFQLVYIFHEHKSCRRNPYEVEVVTKSDFVLWKLEN